MAPASSAASPAPKPRWSGRLDFIMSAFSMAIGMGNVWRFPYLCYRNGGGAFLVPFLAMSALLAVPIMAIEFYLGQYSGQGVIGSWNVCPLLRGCGLLQFFVNFLCSTYYAVIIAYAFYYLFASFGQDVPWRDCNNAWNTPNCMTLEKRISMSNCTLNNGTYINGTCLFDLDDDMMNVTYEKPVSASDEFFHNRVLRLSAGLHDLGSVQWQLLLCLVLAWTVICACVLKGIKSSGKAAYVTALAPYVLLVVLCVRGVLLDGAAAGIAYYVRPDLSKLLTVKVWSDAAVQVFFSMGLCLGGLTTLASYNHFHKRSYTDVLVLVAGDVVTSFFAGFIVFSYLGAMAHRLGVGVDEVATQGPGLAFIVFPDALTLLPGAALWSVLFMLMLVFLGLGTMVGATQLVLTAAMDIQPKFTEKKYFLSLLGAVYVIMIACGIPYTTQGGMYILQLLDSYLATYALLIVGFFMCVTVCWIHGTANFSVDYEQMYRRRPSPALTVTAKFLIPPVLLVLLVLTAVEFHRSRYGAYLFPRGADVGGWALVAAEMAIIPGYAVVLLATRHRGQPLKERLKRLLSPINWQPRDEKFSNNNKLEGLSELKEPLSVNASDVS